MKTDNQKTQLMKKRSNASLFLSMMKRIFLTGMLPSLSLHRVSPAQYGLDWYTRDAGNQCPLRILGKRKIWKPLISNNALHKAKTPQPNSKRTSIRKQLRLPLHLLIPMEALFLLVYLISRELRGITIGKETLRDISNRISQATEPRVTPDIQSVAVKGKSVLLIHIAESRIKPVSVKGRCYKRVGNSNRVMSPQEIAQMHLNATGQTWDQLSSDTCWH